MASVHDISCHRFEPVEVVNIWLPWATAAATPFVSELDRFTVGTFPLGDHGADASCEQDPRSWSSGYTGGVRWSVVEKFVETKIEGRVCEDLIVTTADYAAVIDGASDATHMDFAGRSGGRLAAETMQSAVESLDPHATARQFADELSDRVAQAVGTLPASVRWPAATVICLSFSRNEIWRIGDGSFVIDGQPNVGLLRVNGATCGFRAAYNAALLASGVPVEQIVTDDPGVVLARALTNVQQHLSNQSGPWGYGVVNGRPIPDEFVEVFELAESVRDVALASDGFPDPKPTLDESETRRRELIEIDPAAIADLWTAGKPMRPGANSFDDRAYLRMRR